MAEGNTTIRVLVVEDSELDAELVLDELGNDGMTIEWRRVENEREFLAALVEFGADIIISDVSMPHFSGYRALEISRDSYLQEVRQYLYNDEQFALLRNYERTEFNDELEKLRRMAYGE